MKYKLLRFSLMCILAMLGGVLTPLWADTTGTITFGSNAVKINSATVTGDDDLGNAWTITTAGTTSFTANTAYYQVGSSSKPARSIIFTTTLPNSVTVTSFSAKFGGFSGTDGTVSLKVGDTQVGTGSLNAANDITVTSNISGTGTVLTVSVTGISKGVKCYNISYTYTDPRTATTLTLGDHDETVIVEKSVDLPTATVTAGGTPVSGAVVTWSSSYESVAEIDGQKINAKKVGETTITATYAGNDTYDSSVATYVLTVEESSEIANPYTYTFEAKKFEESGQTVKLKAVNWTVTTDGGYWGYDVTKGQQFGSGSSPAKTLTLTTSDIPGTITGVKINTSGASSIVGTVGVTVGETALLCDEQPTASLTSTATEYEFIGSASGDITISYAQTSSKALYIKSIEVTYSIAEEPAGFRDIKADLTSTALIPEGAAQWMDVSTGISVGADGTLSRVDKTDGGIAFNGKWHGTQYGWAGFTATVPVDGCVKISYGNSNYGSEVTVTDDKGVAVATLNNKAANTWSASNPDLVTVAYYRTNSPTTLNFSQCDYVGYFAVEAIDEADLPEEVIEYSLKYVAGEGAGQLPDTKKYAKDTEITLPANTTLYKEGYTFIGWNDGTKTYSAGAKLKMTSDVTLTAQYAQNTVSLSDRTEPVTLTWQFGVSNGTGILNKQGGTNILVTQATIGEAIIDVKMDIDATNGKINNVGRSDEWAQCNDGTKLTIPSYKGVVVSFNSYNDGTGTTIGGLTPTDKSATYDGSEETLDILCNGMGYIASVTAVYPVPEQDEPTEGEVIYSWTSDEEIGGEVVASDGQSVGYSNPPYNTIRLNGSADFSGATVTVTFEKPLKAGDEIAVTGYRNKDATGKTSGFKAKFEKGESTVASQTGLEFNNINAAVAESDEYGEPNTCTFTVPADADGSLTMTMTRSHTSTNLFITKLVITGKEREEGGEEPVVEYPILYTWDFTDANSACTLEGGGQGTTYSYPSDKDPNVTLEVDATNGKFNPRGTDVQVNASTIINVPVQAEGDVITIYNYRDGSNGVTYTIGTEEKTANNVTYEYTVSKMEAQAGFVTITVTGSGYMDKFTVLQNEPESEGYNNADFAIEWPMVVEGNSDLTAYTSEPVSAVSVASFDYTPSDATVNVEARSKDPDNGLKFVTFKGANFKAHWFVKPAAGLTFTPTQIKLFVQRFGTNKKDGVVVTAKVGDEGTIQTLGTYTARRANWDDSQEVTQWGSALSNLVNEVVIDLTEAQQTALASGEGLHLYATTGLDAGKSGGFADCRIYGKLNGTAATVNKYTLATAVAPADGGLVSAYPAADEYEEGTEVTITATENFGYDFVNWTNGNGEEVSTEAKFKYTVNGNETLTANFKAVETYELALTVDGTNDYMVTIDPAPTMVDGKMMYEAGTAVQLTANSYEGLVTFNNWSDGETGSSKLISMTADTELTAVYSQADIIAGWDFYKKGNEGRIADFASEMNTTSALSLVNTESGDAKGWLDKSTEAAGGYESFKGAAVNWTVGDNDGDVGHYHWQTKVNAKDFTDINVQFQMLYNYNAYQTYNAEYSLDGEEWTKFGSITMTGTKSPVSFNETLPDDCNNLENLFIRMVADKNSKVDGSSSKNDGNTLAMFFITGTQALVDDGKAPELVSTVPAAEADGVSANGKIVLTFNEKVKVVDGAQGMLGVFKDDIPVWNVEPIVSGKTISFEYKGLEYYSIYAFMMPSGTVTDLSGNALEEDIMFRFVTMERPTIEKGLYDKVVEDTEGLLAAINEANSRSDQNTRYRIFLKNGTYTLPLSTTATISSDDGNTYPSPITNISGSNISFIGESQDGVIITNTIDNSKEYAGQFGTTNVYDGISKSDVLQIQSSVIGTYFQDLTVKSSMNDARGRNIAVQDKGKYTIYKNTLLYGYQDTWTSNNDNGYYYFEGGKVRGRTDFLCGKGDAFFNGVDIQVCMATGGYIAVPSKSIKYGYVFKGCNILCESSDLNGKYTLGRPWGDGTPVALWIDTKMQYAPSTIGWSEMSNGWPKQFAEWNSTLTTGTTVDLSGRKTTFGDGHANVPVLTAEEALEAGNLHNMFGDWDPTLATEQAPIPAIVKVEDNTLKWTSSDYALLWAIVKDGAVIDFTTEPSYELTESGTYAVRAANEMGGLSEASESVVATVTEVVKVTLNASGYATLASDKALDFSAIEGLTAYIVKEQTADKAILTSVTATPAETGLVLKGEAGAEFTIPVATSATSIEGNLLVAAVTATAVDTKSVYVLDGDKFKVFTGTEIPAGKAYLPKSGVGARLLEFVFGDATAIGSVNVDVNVNQIYDLQGRRVKTPSKGVYVVDGKKVIIK